MSVQSCEALCDTPFVWDKDTRREVVGRCARACIEHVYLSGRKRYVCWSHANAFANVYRTMPVRFFDAFIQGGVPKQGGRYRLAYSPSYIVCVDCEAHALGRGRHYAVMFYSPDELQGSKMVLHESWFAPGYYELDEAALG